VRFPYNRKIPLSCGCSWYGCISGRNCGGDASPGGSDGNFAAAVGTPVIDGLGPTGSGAHAVDERVSLESLGERISLLSALLVSL